jgi:hypothetical protein
VGIAGGPQKRHPAAPPTVPTSGYMLQRPGGAQSWSAGAKFRMIGGAKFGKLAVSYSTLRRPAGSLPSSRKSPARERRLCEGRTVAENPTPWQVEITPDEFKLFGDCTRDDLEAATGLIEDRAADRELSAGRELDHDVLARRLLMGLTDQQRNLFAVLEMIKMVEGEQAKREDV